MTNLEIVNKFLKSNTCSNLLDSSKKQYESDLNKFFMLINNKHYSELKMVDLEEYTDFYNVEDFSASSVNKHLASFRKFITYLCTFEHNENIDINKFKDAFKSVKDRGGKKAKGCIPMNLSEYIPFNNFILSLQESTWKQQRAKVATLIMSTTGLRRFELQHLLVTDIDFNKMTVTPTTTKGMKQRVRPIDISKKVIEEIVVLFDMYKDNSINGEYVILDENGNMIKQEHQINSMVKRLSTKCVKENILQRNFSPHVLRKSLAVFLRYEGKYDMQAIADILGHESIKTTEIYTQLRVENDDVVEKVSLF